MDKEQDYIFQRLQRVLTELPQGVALVAVSKFHPLEAVMDAYAAGQRLFGESRVQELKAKVEELAQMQGALAEAARKDLRWHFIGHLQTNKVRQLVGLRPAMIESIDSERLLQAVDAEALRQGVVQRVLLQVHVAAEETKTGLSPEEFEDYFKNRRFEQLQATHLCGVMGMASNTDDMSRVSEDFARIAGLFRRATELCPDLRGFDTLSMGMSHDFPLAVEQGANMVRVGTAIFGERTY